MTFEQMGMMTAPMAIAAGLCSIDGGAADALGGGDTTTDTSTDTTTDTTTDTSTDTTTDTSTTDDPEWLAQFSAEGGDADNPANRDWLKSKGFKSIDDVAKSLREAEKTIRNGGKVTVPGADAKPEEVEAYHKAIGRPDNAEGYEFKLPEGAEMDERLVSASREAAFKAGVPKGGYEAIAEAIVQVQQDQLEEMKTAEDADFAAWKKAQGDQVSVKQADANNAMRALNLSQADVGAMQKGFYLTYGKGGSSRVMDMLSTLGAGMAEDALLGGGGAKRFGITGAEAQKEIDQLSIDREFGKKLFDKDPAAVARWDRLNAAVAADRDRQARAAAAS